MQAIPNLDKLQRKPLRRKSERHGVPVTISVVVGSTGRVYLQFGEDKIQYKTHIEATKAIGVILEEAVKVARQPEALSRKD